ncbi:Nitrilase/cyanide hydratase and apolipoprotein N- acyltransferase [Thermocrinis albus DSM 14484]|uniref:Nitrilase/cyanide hydratase and apolipoprotein N-acyltransferase n=1 Tax=Thermocrinis albus (strain DSM 14484 / JCM 11386 / HI 11/12) TaxID=638303 RepID=D3SQC9_THEAH|nr:nitrilase-related carbon-nitrogen hydrolase [Thermocrinis albus]ADC89366.1 Nitrilase/cyanide hydratase and apolipoprotein N- acyltransferase [Thermocrinis albus DSM 14484]
MKAAVIQLQIDEGKSINNLQKLITLLADLEDHLVVVPEMFACGFHYEGMREHARETWEILHTLLDLTKRKSITFVGTLPEEEDGKLYNTAFVLSEGVLVGKRRKSKLFPLYKEPAYFQPGDSNPLFETRHGILGVLICFELRFPQLGWELRRKGAQIICVPSMWGLARKDHLRILSRARAIELQSYLLLANAWGVSGDEEYAGSSAIFGPWGEILAFAEVGDTVLKANLDMAHLEKVRKTLPLFL